MAYRTPKDLVKQFAERRPKTFPQGDAFGLQEKFPDLFKKHEERLDQEYADERVQAEQSVRQAAYEHQKAEFDPHWMGLNIVPGLGPGIVAQISKPQRMKRWKELLTSMKTFKRGSATMRRTLDGIKRLEKNIPQSVWDYVEDIEIKPELGAMGEWSSDKRIMRLNPKQMRPLTTFHETGHAVSSLLLNKTKFSSVFNRVRSQWGALTGDMAFTQKLMEMGYIANAYGDLPPGQSDKLNKIINLLYKGQPEEIFARSFEKSFTEGYNLKQSVKMGTSAVRKTIKQVSKFYDSVVPVHDRLKKSKELQKVLIEVEREADNLVEWLSSPVFRRIEAEYKIGNILKNRGYGSLTEGTTQRGDIIDIVRGWSFGNEKDLRQVAGMLEEGKSLRYVQKKFPVVKTDFGDTHYMDDQYRLIETLIYGDDPARVIETLESRIAEGASGMIRSEKIPRDITKEIAR